MASGRQMTYYIIWLRDGKPLEVPSKKVWDVFRFCESYSDMPPYVTLSKENPDAVRLMYSIIKDPYTTASTQSPSIDSLFTLADLCKRYRWFAFCTVPLDKWLNQLLSCSTAHDATRILELSCYFQVHLGEIIRNLLLRHLPREEVLKVDIFMSKYYPGCK